VICAFNELENAASANHSTHGMATLKSKYRIKSPMKRHYRGPRPALSECCHPAMLPCISFGKSAFGHARVLSVGNYQRRMWFRGQPQGTVNGETDRLLPSHCPNNDAILGGPWFACCRS
jgi:hypothetical protein